ncbi:LuxR C-terminal-related transcriptional regulator [Streptomyces sp. NPDC053048]|uniref:LuxR C-terminal-related transcriptional regulator n=1 Tax=Streptomyces sp. NPDC053048 TaxID=3365694 RepID=UPI0037D47333
MASSPAPSGEPLPTATFAVPAVPRTYVRRQRLLDRIGQGVDGPLTLVTGPAGAGKTTLVAAWARTGAVPGRVVWLTLGPDDGDPGVFWPSLTEGLRRSLPAFPDGFATRAWREGAGRRSLARLAVALERLPEPVVLVLDGFDRTAGREVPTGLESVLARAGPLLRLVVTSREDPGLPLHRYRAEDRLTEIGGADLAFTRHEAAALLRRHGLPAEDDTVRSLTARTEGWAAGLKLCVLAMRRSDDPAAFARSGAGPEHAVSGYLLTEAFGTRPAAARELLLRTSVLERVEPELANALTGRRDAERTLNTLARSNGFVEAVDGTSCFRVHPLYASVLRTHLRAERPGLTPLLHARAARRLAAAGRVTEAVEHAAAAGDWQYAAGGIVRRSMTVTLLTGPAADRLTGLFCRMPSDVGGTEPALVAAACRLARGDLAGCRRRLAAAGPALRGGPPGADPEARLAHALLWLLCGPYEDAGGTDEAVRAGAAARTVRELMKRVPPGRLEAYPGTEALRCHGLARALLRAGRLDEARDAFAAVVRACEADTAGLARLRQEALGTLALAEAVAGALGAAEDHALRGLATADRYGVPPGGRSGSGYLALATVASERDDGDAVRRHLEQAERCRDTHDDVVLAAERTVLRSRLELDGGRREGALAALREHGPVHAVWDTERLALARSAAALACGDPRAAVAALRGTGADGPAPVVALAFAHLAAGRTGRALGLVRYAGRSPRLNLPDRVRILLLRARAAMLEGDRAQAYALVAQAADAARPERLSRPFSEAAPWLRQLLDVPVGHGGAARAASWLAEGRQNGDGTGEGNGHGSVNGSAPGSGPALVEPLSGREREVLACVARMMSTEEIAAELHVSVNTVKTHLRSVYHKLCVSRRRAAVERGRELRIL